MTEMYNCCHSACGTIDYVQPRSMYEKRKNISFMGQFDPPPGLNEGTMAASNPGTMGHHHHLIEKGEEILNLLTYFDIRYFSFGFSYGKIHL